MESTTHYNAVSETTLANGLRVLCAERHNLPIVTVMTCYRVGGVNTLHGKTGIAHFLEHMMFKGTKKFARGHIDLITQRLGGHNNAFTSMDATCYYFSFAADRWEKALEIEADRMRNCHWSKEDFVSEKQVILEELNSGLDSPLEFLSQQVQMVSYQYHPYRNPIIGWRNHLENLTIQELHEFYDLFYRPNNAILVLVGDFDTSEALKKVEKTFGRLERGPKLRKPQIVESPQTFQKRVYLQRPVQLPRFEVLFHTCSPGTREEYVLDLIDIILATGRSSRLYRRMVLAEKVAQNVGTFNDIRRQGGTFHIIGELYPGTPCQRAEEILQSELTKLHRYKIGKYELARAKNIFLADFVFQQETTYNFAEKIVDMEIAVGHTDLQRVLETIEEINATDLQEVARQYLQLPHATIGFSTPENSTHPPRRVRKEKLKSLRGNRVSSDDSPMILFRGNGKRGEIHQCTLDNGLTILMLENRILPLVAMEIHTRGGFACDPPEKTGTSYLLGRLLSEGTCHQSAQDLASTVEFLGGSINTTATRVSTKSFSRDFPTMCSLAAEIIHQPEFSPKALEAEKRKLLASLVGQKDNASAQARNKFYRTIYGSHPFASPPQGSAETIARIRKSDIVKFHARHFVPHNTVIAIAGDICPRKTPKLIEKYFGQWQDKELEFPAFPRPKLPRKPSTHYINMKDKQQLTIFWGHLGVDRFNPDYYALLLLDNILGVGAGFTDRLSRKIRDEMGLVYSVWASITSNASLEPGTFTAYLATDPRHYHRAMETLREEITNVQNDIDEQELEDAKAYLTGSFVFALESNTSLADYLLATHRYKLGFDYVDRFPEVIRGITREQVVAAAQKYLHPNAATTVVAGPVGKIEGVDEDE